MKLNINELETSLEPVTGNKFYDTIIAAAKELFGSHRVTYDEKLNKIYVKRNIFLTFTLSNNENKVYIDTYIGKDLDIEAYVILHKANESFRLFTIEDVVNYLEMKWLEDKFIRQNGD